MIKHLRDFLSFLNWGWFLAVIIIAVVLVPLFPFEDISFDYISRPAVLAVMGKTALIAIPVVLGVGSMGYVMHLANLWERNPIAALLVHAICGITLPFVYVVWMISVLYSPNIVAHEMYQTDLVFSIFLLAILNFWMRVRIEASNVKKLSDDLVVLGTEIASVSTARLQLDAENSILQSSVADLEAKTHALQSQHTEAIMDYEKINIAYNLLNKENEPENKARDYIEIKFNGELIVLHDSKISHVHSQRIDQNSIVTVVDLEDNSFYPSATSMVKLIKEDLPELIRLSRNYAVMGHAIKSYELKGSNQMLVYFGNLKKPVLVKGKFYKECKDRILNAVLTRVDQGDEQSSPTVQN